MNSKNSRKSSSKNLKPVCRNGENSRFLQKNRCRFWHPSRPTKQAVQSQHISQHGLPKDRANHAIAPRKDSRDPNTEILEVLRKN